MVSVSTNRVGRGLEDGSASNLGLNALPIGVEKLTRCGAVGGKVERALNSIDTLSESSLDAGQIEVAFILELLLGNRDLIFQSGKLRIDIHGELMDRIGDSGNISNDAIHGMSAHDTVVFFSNFNVEVTFH